MKEIILATSNPGKISELTTILSSFHCIPQNELGIAEVEEKGLSFIENALIKARNASFFGHRPALADDSGLIVQALKGAPGIYSARFAGQKASEDENINLLLNKLKGIPESQCQAYYYCCIAILRHAEDPIPIIATGTWGGTIIQNRMGELGFGYDPIFYLKDYHCTVAQLSMELKNRMSHRAQALNQLRNQLSELAS
jgi:XTP/dITP diphosphohydrolase